MAQGNSDVVRTGMRPRIGQETMSLPVTFDYHGGRKDKQKTAKMWAIMLSVLEVIIFFGLMFHKGSNFFINIFMSLASLLIVSSIIRFPILKEGKLRQEKIRLHDSDGVIDLQKLWGIYDIGDIFPYICRFRSGRSGVFILLNKDVILGKYSEAEFEHYEAIGDSYNIGGSSNIQICHLDYMDIVGSDERLDQSFISLQRVSNPDLKDLLTDIYTYQQEQMSRQVTTFDVYLFSWSGSDDSAWNTIQRMLSCFMDANYRSYHVLNKTDLRELVKTLHMLEDFSVEGAMLKTFSSNSVSSFVPIRIKHSDGTIEELNKTREERKEEAELAQKKEELRKEEQKKRKKSKGAKLNEDEEIDLF